VYPEFILLLYWLKDSNLLELEDELAGYVDLIIIPESQGIQRNKLFITI
jgi:hypothetical protein